MAISKITGDLYETIRSWVWERKKTIRPNPLKPSNTQIVTEKEIDNNKLQKTLIGFRKKIDKIIDEVNKLIKQVAKNKNEITKINKKLQIMDNTIKLKSTATHVHAAATPLTSGPMGRKGGSVRKMQPGGRTRPVPRRR